MTKVHEETWEAEERGYVTYGPPVAPDKWRGAVCGEQAHTRLIAVAPEMARLLLKLEWASSVDGYPVCPECLVNEGLRHTSTCALDALLRKAGVR